MQIQYDEHSPLLPIQQSNVNIEAGPDKSSSGSSIGLNPITQFIKSHSRALHVAADSLSTLAPFQLVNNILEGWPETYDENLNTLNKAFAAYFVIQLILSILYHHSHDEEKKAPLPIAIPALFLLTSMVMMSYVLDSLQDNIIAAQAQVTHPEGGENSVSDQTFWGYDFGTPAAIAFSYGALQFAKEVHHLLTTKGILNKQKLKDAIPSPVKATIKVVDKVFTFGVESVAVFGSLYQDLSYYSISYAGVNLLEHKQYYTSLLYGGGLILGVTTSTLFEANILNRLITKANFEKLVVVTGGALGISVFYTSNIADTRKYGINPSTMTSMVGLPVLLMVGTGAYMIWHNVAKKPKTEVVIEPVDEPIPNNQETGRELLAPPVRSQNITIPANITFFGKTLHGSLPPKTTSQDITHSI